ncbi:hypothetical protein B0H14DRAFT_2577814 [Mycena olivaceomarginata]|nr:hypothetical protein B0H14DRAFT_2577814 [Mycena olivaceomarginata]
MLRYRADSRLRRRNPFWVFTVKGFVASEYSRWNGGGWGGIGQGERTVLSPVPSPKSFREIEASCSMMLCADKASRSILSHVGESVVIVPNFAATVMGGGSTLNPAMRGVSSLRCKLKITQTQASVQESFNGELLPVARKIPVIRKACGPGQGPRTSPGPGALNSWPLGSAFGDCAEADAKNETEIMTKEENFNCMVQRRRWVKAVLDREVQ